MERHAAFPDAQDRERILGVDVEIVEQHVAEPPAQDDTEKRPEDQIIDIARRHGVRRLGDEGAHVKPREAEAHQVGERIPADTHGAYDRPCAKIDQDRVDGGERKSEHHAGRILSQTLN